MKFRGLIAGALSVVMLVSLMSGCQSQKAGDSKTGESKTSSEPVTLTVAFEGDGSTKATYQKWFDEFTTENPNIKINQLYVAVSGSSWPDFFTKIQTMIAGGSSPDVVFIATEGIKMFENLGLCMPIDEYITGDSAKIMGNISSSVQEQFKQDGKNYAVATSWNNECMHMNTKLLKDAGLSLPAENWNKETFLDYCSKLTKTVDGKKQYAIGVPTSYFAVESWLYNNNASYYNDDMTKCTINEPNAVEVFQLMQDLVQKYKYAPYPDGNADQAQQMMAGQIAMYSTGRWKLGEYQDNKFSDVAVQFIPNFKTNKVICGSGAAAVLKSTKHPAEAAKMAIWTAGDYFQTNYGGISGIPTNNSIAETVIKSATVPQNSDLFLKSSKLAVAVQAPVQYAELGTIFDKYLSEILTQPVNVKDTLDKEAAEMDAALAKK